MTAVDTWSKSRKCRENLKPTGLLQIKVSYTQTIKLNFKSLSSSTMVLLLHSQKNKPHTTRCMICKGSYSKESQRPLLTNANENENRETVGQT